MKNKQDDIQYFHDAEAGRSYAVQVDFSKEALSNVLHHFTEPFYVKLGVSKVHPEDEFNKRIGREVSSHNLKKVKLQLDHIKVEENRAVFTFTAEEENLILVFRTHKDSEKPHLLNIFEPVFYF